jgi:hypothetical protein
MAGPLAGPDAPENTRVFPCRKSNNIHYTDWATQPLRS